MEPAFFLLPGREFSDKENLLNILNCPEELDELAARAPFKPFDLVGMMVEPGTKAMKKGSLFAEDASCETPHQVDILLHINKNVTLIVHAHLFDINLAWIGIHKPIVYNSSKCKISIKTYWPLGCVSG